jgi:molecular chaperone DnaK
VSKTKEAEANKSDDDRRKQVVEARTHADAAIRMAEKTLAEHVDNAADDGLTKVKTALADLRAVIGSDDLDAMTTRTLALAGVLSSSQQRFAPGNSQAADDGVVDAEFEAA